MTRALSLRLCSFLRVRALALLLRAHQLPHIRVGGRADVCVHVRGFARGFAPGWFEVIFSSMLFVHILCPLRLPEQWAPRLVEELRAINDTSAEALWVGLHRISPAFIYEGGCAFDLFLLELALRHHGPEENGAALTPHEHNAQLARPGVVRT